MKFDTVIPRAKPHGFKKCKRCGGQMFQGYASWEWSCLQCGHMDYTEDKHRIPEETYV